MKLPEEKKAAAEQKPATKATPEDVTNIVSEYVERGYVTKNYASVAGLSLTLKTPSQEQLMHAIEEVDAIMFRDNESLSVDRVQLVRNNNMISLYTAGWGKKNFIEEQGDLFATKESFLARREYLMKNVDVYAMEWAIKMLTSFQDLVSSAFSDENLKNS
ncbi:MAG: hypothetical protein Q8M92_05110 [Candidatus Subteraquimicrobiales bacterium]|nr:hypothetical protein [Candidatus Subteraquimicrobiales bacterium]